MTSSRGPRDLLYHDRGHETRGRGEGFPAGATAGEEEGVAAQVNLSALLDALGLKGNQPWRLLRKIRPSIDISPFLGLSRLQHITYTNAAPLTLSVANGTLYGLLTVPPGKSWRLLGWGVRSAAALAADQSLGLCPVLVPVDGVAGSADFGIGPPWSVPALSYLYAGMASWGAMDMQAGDAIGFKVLLANYGVSASVPNVRTYAIVVER